METQTQSEFRCMTPEEIGAFVRDYREKGGIKQLALANRAGVSERTIQRMERGEPMGEDTLRAVAKALYLKPEAFIGPRLIRTEEEELQLHLNWMKNFTIATLKPVNDWRAFEELMQTNGIIFDDAKLSADDAALACGIHDYLVSLRDSVKLMTYAERIQEAKKLLEMLEELSENGIRAKYMVTETIEEIRIGQLDLVHVDHQMAGNDQVLVPNSYSQYGNAKSMAEAEAFATGLAHYRSVDSLGSPR